MSERRHRQGMRLLCAFRASADIYTLLATCITKDQGRSATEVPLTLQLRQLSLIVKECAFRASVHIYTLLAIIPRAKFHLRQLSLIQEQRPVQRPVLSGLSAQRIIGGFSTQ